MLLNSPQHSCFTKRTHLLPQRVPHAFTNHRLV